MSLSSLSSLSDEEIPASSIRRKKVRLNSFEEYDDTEFKKRFRLSKETVLFLESVFGENVAPLTKRNQPIQSIDQILITLRYYATGGYQSVIGDVFNVQQPTIHRIVHKVTAEIAKLSPVYIKMPTPQECHEIANDFCGIAGFPGVMGAVGSTHIKIISPRGQQSETFRNKNGYFSFNVQMVCDARLVIRHVIATGPGSVPESIIFNDSPLCAQLEQGDFGDMMLLGNSGYSCHSYLLTPILKPRCPAEEAYNQAHKRTLSPIDRLFGVLKRRFACLQTGIGLKIGNIPPIVVACAVLHNIAIDRQDGITDDVNIDEIVEEENIMGNTTN